FDMLYIPKNNVQVLPQIHVGNNELLDVGGYSRMAVGMVLNKSGISTGNTQGELQGYINNGTLSTRVNGTLVYYTVRELGVLKADSTHGDSGGPVYDGMNTTINGKYKYRAYIAGIIAGGNEIDEVYFVPSSEIRDEFGLVPLTVADVPIQENYTITYVTDWGNGVFAIRDTDVNGVYTVLIPPAKQGFVSNSWSNGTDEYKFNTTHVTRRDLILNAAWYEVTIPIDQDDPHTAVIPLMRYLINGGNGTIPDDCYDINCDGNFDNDDYYLLIKYLWETYQVGPGEDIYGWYTGGPE
ncbi:MAG: hypothetical protein II940_01615, partial [Methanosarcinaceae archaeon]|nr:hypothetical protein [Methanosarcinaceae archaeon]